jgi:hypothetical protein
MPSKWRRFEILLPRQFNDGAEIPGEWLGEAASELFEHFGAVTFETQILLGQWRDASGEYSDKLSKLVIDLPNTPSNRRWMKAYRDRWKLRLKQVELWLVSYTITVE